MSPKRIKRNQSATSQEPIVDEDIISNLPRNVIDYILGKMPIREAVRTSVLSKKWRFYYLTIPQLVFDYQFVKELYYFAIKRCAPIFSLFEFKYQFNEIVTKSLMLNPDRIEKFRVLIPNFNRARVPDVNKWILYLSQKNIKKITLEYPKVIVRHELPPYFFSCLDLTYVKLNNVDFSLPPEFKGFRNLDRLSLSRVRLANNCFERFLSSCPVLKMLVLHKCSGIRHFIISGSNLLRIKAAYMFQSISLENASNLAEVYVTLESLEIGLEGNPIFDLVKFVGSLRNVKRLVLDGKFLQLLAGTPVPPTL
ncbi:PREDICTED: F-box/FBD/LRR-repeat protein At1g13570-like [Nicotiana attenuata]|uniref:F-box/FBD/LRR-repeat protein At1g13570-like n=1 Tax=Nicotiana attenuata TaxID=49451 RepID=UPI00090586AD|nr:PREDICTED: F-box/FBD/LRR-repeat protein At1g13570-like [Nicotiana attenuata]XP_019244692.1 PREDICTED: F-box/FBD/LRR-repeat protein At1g13570-like [Nicotiana attenuata]